MFSTYESVDSGIVLMGNNAACKVIVKALCKLKCMMR